MPAPTRRRLPAELAKTRILEAAEKRLIEGGPEAVRVQSLARDLGLTDAAIHHHFGSREGLLEALLHFGGRRLRDAVAAALSGRPEGELDPQALIEGLLPVLEGSGYSRLALWLWSSGWRDKGSGLFDEVAYAIERSRRPQARGARVSGRAGEESRWLAAWLVLTLIAEPIFGRSARRSVSLGGDAAATQRFRAWLPTAFGRLLETLR